MVGVVATTWGGKFELGMSGFDVEGYVEIWGFLAVSDLGYEELR